MHLIVSTLDMVGYWNDLLFFCQLSYDNFYNYSSLKTIYLESFSSSNTVFLLCQSFVLQKKLW